MHRHRIRHQPENAQSEDLDVAAVPKRERVRSSEPGSTRVAKHQAGERGRTTEQVQEEVTRDISLKSDDLTPTPRKWLIGGNIPVDLERDSGDGAPQEMDVSREEDVPVSADCDVKSSVSSSVCMTEFSRSSDCSKQPEYGHTYKEHKDR